MQLKYQNTEINDIQAVLYQMPDSEFHNLTRSTLPLLAYWKNQESTIKEILHHIGCQYASDWKLCFEYKVESANDRCKPSFTDVMFVSDPVSIAFEGKWTEPRYKIAGEWLSKGNKNNRLKVLHHWLSLIQDCSKKKLNCRDFDKAVYQMIYRTASACSLHSCSEKVIVLYQCFSESPKLHVDYKSDLEALYRLISPTEKLGFYLQMIRIEKTSFYYELERELKNKTNNKAALIRQGLWNNDLFRIKEVQFELI